MLLHARSLDPRARAALQPAARLLVHSTFERALNLLDENGQLLGLVGPRGGNGPGLVVLAALPPTGFAALGLGARLTAHVDAAGCLRIGVHLSVDLRSAELWRRPLPTAAAAPDLVWSNLRLARDLAYRQRGADGLGGLLPHLEQLLSPSPGGVPEPPVGLSPLLRVAWLGLTELLPAWRAGDPETVVRAAGRLVGLGPGQTPSGDDLLAGFMVASAAPLLPLAGAHSLEQSPLAEGAGAAPLRQACLESARGRTTDLGFARLRYAADGELDERSELTLAALLAGDRVNVEVATRDLLAYGHSSGLDTLVGLMLGVGYQVLGVGD